MINPISLAQEFCEAASGVLESVPDVTATSGPAVKPTGLGR